MASGPGSVEESPSTLELLDLLTSKVKDISGAKAIHLERTRLYLLDLSRHQNNPNSTPVAYPQERWIRPYLLGDGLLFDSRSLSRLPLPPVTNRDSTIMEGNETAADMDIYPRTSNVGGVRFQVLDDFQITDELHKSAVKEGRAAFAASMKSSPTGRFLSYNCCWSDGEGGPKHSSPFADGNCAATVCAVRSYAGEILRFFRNRLPKHSSLLMPIHHVAPGGSIEYVEQILHGLPIFLQNTIVRAFIHMHEMNGLDRDIQQAYSYDDFLVMVSEIVFLLKDAESKREKRAWQDCSKWSMDIDESLAATQEVCLQQLCNVSKVSQIAVQAITARGAPLMPYRTADEWSQLLKMTESYRQHTGKSHNGALNRTPMCDTTGEESQEDEEGEESQEDEEEEGEESQEDEQEEGEESQEDD